MEHSQLDFGVPKPSSEILWEKSRQSGIWYPASIRFCKYNWRDDVWLQQLILMIEKILMCLSSLNMVQRISTSCSYSSHWFTLCHQEYHLLPKYVSECCSRGAHQMQETPATIWDSVKAGQPINFWYWTNFVKIEYSAMSSIGIAAQKLVFQSTNDRDDITTKSQFFYVESQHSKFIKERMLSAVLIMYYFLSKM